jgi:hypothetical protein
MIEPAPRRRKYHFGGGDGRNRRAVKSLAHTPDLVVCKDTDPAAEVAPNVSPNAVDNAHRQECACRRPCARLRTRDDLDFPTKSAGATPTTPRQAPSRSPPTRRRHRQPHQELGQPAPPTHPATSHISFSRNRHANGHHLQLSRNRHANGHHLQLSRNPHGELPAPAAFAKPPRRTASTYSFRETPTANGQHLQLSRNPHGELPAPAAFAKPPRRTASTCSFRETPTANRQHLQLSRNRHGEPPAPTAFAKPPRRTASTYSFRETPTANCQHLQLSRNPHGELPAPTAFAKPPRRTASTCSFRETAAAPPGVFTKAFSDWARD